MSDWQLIGKIGVDAGMVQIGDPCYMQDRNIADYWKNKAIDWNDLALNHKGVLNIPFTIEDGDTWTNVLDAGAGIIVHSGYGDGCYNVYAKFNDGRVAAVMIEFIDEDERVE